MFENDSFREFREENKIANICSAKIIRPWPKSVYCDRYLTCTIPCKYIVSC